MGADMFRNRQREMTAILRGQVTLALIEVARRQSHETGLGDISEVGPLFLRINPEHDGVVFSYSGDGYTRVARAVDQLSGVAFMASFNTERALRHVQGNIVFGRFRPLYENSL
jgi:hypothetical protein